MFGTQFSLHSLTLFKDTRIDTHKTKKIFYRDPRWSKSTGIGDHIEHFENN